MTNNEKLQAIADLKEWIRSRKEEELTVANYFDSNTNSNTNQQ